MEKESGGKLPVRENPVIKVLPFKGWRKVLAERMLSNHLSCAEVTQMREVDATELVSLRQQMLHQFQTEHGVRLTFTHLLIKIVAHALQQHPMLNSALVGEEIHIFQDCNIAIAVALEDGSLLAPVVPQANSKSIVEIARESARLIEQVRSKRFSLDCLTGGTFTITNAGMYGTDFVTPLISLPQTAALGVGKLVKKPAVWNDQITIRMKMGLSLTYDHRVISGAVAAEFFQTLEKLIDNPAQLDLGN